MSSLVVDPIVTIEKLIQTEDCDEKYVLLHLADKEIVNRLSNSDLLQFNNKWLLEERKDELNKYDHYVLNNQLRFRQSSEGYPVRVRKYWLNKINSKNNDVLESWELESIKKLDEAVWEDGDGSMHTDNLIKSYMEHMIKYPNSEKKQWILNRIDEMEQRTVNKQETPLSASTLTGKYSTVTESDCNMELLLQEDGRGKAIQTCRLEDGSHRDATNETLIKWEQEGGNVIVTTSREETVFTYKPSLSCKEYGAKGHSAALILQTKGNHLFSSFNSSYWKVPIKCKHITEE